MPRLAQESTARGPRLLWAGLLCGTALAALVLIASAPAAAGDPPVANINSPANNTVWEAGKPVPFSAALSFDPDQNVTTYSMDYIWQFPNETLAGVDLKVFNYTNFTDPGNYTVRLTVIDEEGLEGYDNVTVRIVPENLLPTAVIASPSDGSRFFTTEFIAFSGSGSSDPEGGPLAYTWVLDGSSQLGTGSPLSVKLPPGQHVVTLRVQDDRGAEGTSTVHVTVSVNVPPRLEAPLVSPLNGTAGGDHTFTVTYYDDNGEPAASVLLVLDGAFHDMVAQGNQSPVDGVPYAITLAPAAGAHTFYMIASDGNLTNVSTTEVGPTLWEPVLILSDDGLAVLTTTLLPPHDLSLAVEPSEVPPAPEGLVALSPPYRVAGTALQSDDLRLTLSFSFMPGVRRSTASVYALAPNGSAWNGLVSAVDTAGGTVRVDLPADARPAMVRVFAEPLAEPANAPPTLAMNYSGTTEPNATITFDGSGSADPEGANVALAWRFAGPGLDTGWVAGDRVQLAFPQAGTYGVFLRGEDGAGNTAFRNMTVQIVSPETHVITPPDEGVVIASLAVAVAVSAVLAVWWRSRTPAPTRTYDDLYGRAYKERMWDEREYRELFHKFADAPPQGEPPAEPEPEGEP